MSEERVGEEFAAGQTRSQLLEKIYGTALDPHSYGEFMALWERYLGESIREEETDSSEALRVHFETAFRILEEQGRGVAGHSFEEDHPSHRPALMIDQQSRVAWSNGAASSVFGLGLRPVLADLALEPLDLVRLEEMVALLADVLRNSGDCGEHLVRLNGEDGEVHVMLASVRTEANGERFVALRDVHQEWPAGGSRLLENFGLSAAEKHIAELVFEGHDAVMIAQIRDSSPATVRTQIKSLMGKTGRRSQVELTRLLFALARVAERQAEQRAGEEEVPPRMVRLGERELPFYAFGPPRGRPVIFFHGMLDGCLIPQEMVRLLFRHRLRLIAPVRPSFGVASPARGAISQVPEEFARDVAAMVDALDLPRVVLMGHMAGSIYAHEAARVLGGRAVGMLAVAGAVPIVSSAQLASMSRRQRVVAHTARYAPGLLKFVVRAGIRQIDNGGIRRFMGALYQDTPRDLEALQDPDVFDLVQRGYHFTIAQGHLGFETDSYHVVRDWSHRMEGHALGVRLLHGRHDPAVNAASVEEFAARYRERVSLEMLEDAGQLLLYERPEKIVAALCELHERADA